MIVHAKMHYNIKCKKLELETVILACAQVLGNLESAINCLSIIVRLYLIKLK